MDKLTKREVKRILHLKNIFITEMLNISVRYEYMFNSANTIINNYYKDLYNINRKYKYNTKIAMKKDIKNKLKLIPFCHDIKTIILSYMDETHLFTNYYYYYRE